MPKGPQGQKRPADGIGCANLVAKIATGEEIETTATKLGVAGGIARAIKLNPAKRSKIAKDAAKQRWQKREYEMAQVENKDKKATDSSNAVRMYSNNSLKEPVRAFEDTFSGYDLLKKHFQK